MKVSQAQVRISQEQIYDQYQPVLFPFHITQREINEMNLRGQGRISAKNGIKNVGPGVALNIRGVIFDPKPSDSSEKVQYKLNLLFSTPLAPGDSMLIVGRPQGLRMSGDWQIGKSHQYSLYAPTYSQEEIEEGKQPVKNRLTLTYHDVFGRKHASIFDLTYDGKPDLKRCSPGRQMQLWITAEVEMVFISGGSPYKIRWWLVTINAGVELSQ